MKPLGVLVHGYSCTREHWADTADALAGVMDCRLVSLPGHDDTPLPEATLDIPACARHIDAVVTASGRGDAVLIGHSLGGMAGMICAAERPDLYRGLVLVDAFPAMGPPDPFGRSFWSGSPPGLRPGLVRGMMAARRRLPSTLWESITRFDGAPILPRISSPVRGIYGDRGEADHEALTRGLLGTGLDQAPDVEVYIVGQAGHFVMLEQPALFREMLTDVVVDLAGR